MSKDEVKALFKRIKAHYDKFSTSQEKLEEWYKILKDYRVNGVNHALDDYLLENHEEPPKVVSLINETIRVESKKGNLYCDFCKKKFVLENYEEYQKHVQRHNSINYIKSREHLIKCSFDKQKLFVLSDEKFDEIYDKFIERIVDLVIDPYEKKRLENCILSSKGVEIQFDTNLYRELGIKR